MNSSRMRTLIGTLAICLVAMLVGSAVAEDKLPKKYTETITTRTGAELSLDMVLIPGGTFTMGSPAGEADRNDDEGPQRKVSLDPFYLCTTETTLEWFMAYYQETGTAKKEFVEVAEAQKNAQAAAADGVNAISGPTPVYGDMTMGYSVKHPAMGMSWHNAMTFCQWLSQKTGKPYRLPTEAEWEYAARAGTTTPFGCAGDADKVGDYAWFEDNSDFGPGAVGTRKPNAWGLYDMQGNVREWVHDFYQPNAYAEMAGAKNPTGPKEGKVNVARGGCYDSPAGELRCAARAYEEDWWRMNDPQIPKSKWWLPPIDFIGFRVACSVPQDTK